MVLKDYGIVMIRECLEGRDTHQLIQYVAFNVEQTTKTRFRSFFQKNHHLSETYDSYWLIRSGKPSMLEEMT